MLHWKYVVWFQGVSSEPDISSHFPHFFKFHRGILLSNTSQLLVYFYSDYPQRCLDESKQWLVSYLLCEMVLGIAMHSHERFLTLNFDACISEGMLNEFVSAL